MTKRKFTYTIAIILLIVIASIFSIVGGGVTEAHAAATTSADKPEVISELSRDINFNAEDYPQNSKDYSLNVMQIAENRNGKVFLFVYNPCAWTKPLTAKSVNMALSESVNGTRLYSLQLLSRSGVFAKYLVSGATADKLTKTHYYNVSSIYREWDESIDKSPDNNNTVSLKAYPVGKVFKVQEADDGNLVYSQSPTYVVEIIDPYVDYFIYVKDRPGLPSNHAYLGAAFDKWGIIDSHYIAFSTDWDIETLLSADVHYYYRSASGIYDTLFGKPLNGSLDYGSDENTTVTVRYDQKKNVTGSGAFGKKYSYSWNRIQTATELLETEENLTDETKKNLDGKQWVLRFAETERTQKEVEVLSYKHYKTNFTQVDRVTILRLEFETAGTVYNLGAVSDEQSGDGSPGNAEEKKPSSNFLEEILKAIGKWFKNLIKKIPVWGWILIALALVGIIMGILSIFLPAVRGAVKVIFKGLLTVLKFVVFIIGWIIALPFRLIGKLFGGIKNCIEERRERNEYLRAKKIDRKDRAVLERYQNKLDRKESNYQEKLDEKDMAKKQKRKAQAKKRSRKK